MLPNTRQGNYLSHCEVTKQEILYDISSWKESCAEIISENHLFSVCENFRLKDVVTVESTQSWLLKNCRSEGHLRSPALCIGEYTFKDKPLRGLELRTLS